MRILLVHDYGTLNGGAELMIVHQREALRNRGHDARLFTSTARPLPLPIMADETCFGTVSPLRRGLQAFNPHARHRLRRVLASFRPDVVLVKMFLTQLSPQILPLLRDVPAVLSVVNYNLLCPLNTKTLLGGEPCRLKAGAACHSSGCMPWLGVARHRVQRMQMDLSVFDHVFANSQWVSRRLREEGVRADSVIHNGITPRPLRPPLGPRPLAAYAGRLVPKKGVDVLLSALATVRVQIPGVRLVVVGDGPERGQLERLAVRLGIRDSVEFTGHLGQQDMEKTLGEAWVQAVPSVWEEPFGLVAAEAMLRGTAVVASNTGGLTEQVIEGETGYLASPGDPESLAGALGRVLADREHAESLGRAGHAHAMQNFMLDSHVDRVLDVCREVVRERRPVP